MRVLAPTTCLLALLLLSGCAAGTPTADPTRTAKPTATPTATPMPSAPETAAPETAAPLTEPEQLAKQTQTAVGLYSQVVCSNLAEHPSIDLNAAVEMVLKSYATEGLSEASRVELAQRVLEQSAAASCPDQSERVTANLAE